MVLDDNFTPQPESASGTIGMAEKVAQVTVVGQPMNVATTSSSPATLAFLAIFCAVQKAGAWLVAMAMRITAIFGGVDLDFREAVWPESGEVVLNLLVIFGGCDIKMGVPPPGVSLSIKSLCIFGGCDIIVPPAVGVKSAGLGIFGGFNDTCGAGAVGGPPQLKISGVAIFGGIDSKSEAAPGGP